MRRFALTVVIVTLVAQVGLAGATAADPPEVTSTYTNPVTASFTRNFADPAVIRGRDGYWYGYATNGRRTPGDERHLMMIAKSADLVHWEYVGDVFTPQTMPRYDGRAETANRQFWAPSIKYFGGRYLLYYSYVVNDGADQMWRAIGVATADHPAGPWTDSGSPVTGPETWEPRPGTTAWRNVIDPDVFTGPDGHRYLYYGSVLGGVRVVELSADGLHTVGERTQLTPENRYEAAYVVNRAGWYYLFLSVIGGCCAGPVSAYPVVVARSRSPLGPFTDRDGQPVSGRHAGGTPVQVPNGNQWLSPGHNAIATDLSGQDWLVTHGIDRAAPFVAGTENARGLMISRLDWIDGWPVANGGRGLPAGAAPGPHNDTIVADAVTGPELSDVWEPADGWTVRAEPTGGYLRAGTAAGQTVLATDAPADGDVRGRVAVRLGTGDQAGLVLARHGSGGGITALIDKDRQALVTSARVGSREVRAESPLPASFQYGDWHELTVERRGERVHAEVSDAGLYDPVAQVDLTVPAGLGAGPTGLVAKGNGGAVADFDDITVARLYRPVTDLAPDPEVGQLDPAYSEEFHQPLGDAWRWVRSPSAVVVDGRLTLPLQTETLIDQRPKADDDASLLLRDPPPGEWTAETKVTVPFGDTLPYGWPMAGLIAYTGDDDWVLLGSATRVDPRYVTFGTELTYDGTAKYGHAAIGPQADSMWLRLQHRVDPGNGEHEYRAATSIDGRNWLWHGVRTLPAGPQPQLGLVAMDRDHDPTGATNNLSAGFDYLRFHRP
ncbi:glycoside hydrolase family 43 [Kribbella turkmenica]|uniref:Glycoside hydrolase family 43 n=1 Tax=Kribbella turkmenica TaxID=2530375 RepID=A0A4V6PD20_9ACTN|nr:family 43 glycosylhydrolase [Kribbella turkmenica]TDD19006.1 glycoside hydrolase family 43 [Kribbella turkmenica]